MVGAREEREEGEPPHCQERSSSSGSAAKALNCGAPSRCFRQKASVLFRNNVSGALLNEYSEPRDYPQMQTVSQGA